VELVYTPPAQRAGPSAQAQAWLDVDGVRYHIPREGMTIGRATDCDLQLADEQVSRRHARIEMGADRSEVIDLESANGTLVNGRNVERHVLRDGDVIEVGKSRIVFHAQKKD
jgi:pSer/pThr/pTyr-binding forkhead associated (FHA) protein